VADRQTYLVIYPYARPTHEDGKNCKPAISHTVRWSLYAQSHLSESVTQTKIF
jgi:hypothetical protein